MPMMEGESKRERGMGEGELAGSTVGKVLR